MIRLQKPAAPNGVSIRHGCLRHVASVMMDHMARAAEQLARQPGPVAELSLVLGPTQNQRLSEPLNKRD